MKFNAVTAVKTVAFAGMTILSIASLGFAKTKAEKLAKKLLHGDEAAQMDAINTFNKLPADEQYKLVPDFMVGMTDDDPKVRKIASRILKVMGVTPKEPMIDAQKEMPAPEPTKPAAEKWKEEKKLQEIETPPTPKEMATPPTKPVGGSPWTADLDHMRGEKSDNSYADLKDQLALEKKGQVTLDATELKADSDSYVTPLASVIQSLSDPDPWVRAQAARRLALIHPAPVETIPTLMTMLDDKSVECRQAGAAALGSFGPLARNAVTALRGLLSDPDPGVSQIAGEALKQIQHP